MTLGEIGPPSGTLFNIWRVQWIEGHPRWRDGVWSGGNNCRGLGLAFRSGCNRSLAHFLTRSLGQQKSPGNGRRTFLCPLLQPRMRLLSGRARQTRLIPGPETQTNSGKAIVLGGARETKIKKKKLLLSWWIKSYRG